MTKTNKMQEAVAEFTKNPYWQKYYEQAPSEGCKQHIALTFCYSLYGEPANIKERKAELEKNFTVTDWKYLYDHEGNNPFKAKCKRKINELS